mmetsp:Transcript_37981/g.101186  ORF Transcript_37981/g.101186 Transcript_37981/m.101186 type:complete len:147 (+) Transcript_37981:410-850(+)
MPLGAAASLQRIRKVYRRISGPRLRSSEVGDTTQEHPSVQQDLWPAIAKFSVSCSYGHVPGAIWAPELFQCGACSPEGGLDCSAERQEHVDAKILSGHREPRSAKFDSCKAVCSLACRGISRQRAPSRGDFRPRGHSGLVSPWAAH